MTNKLIPLHYAIIKYFIDGQVASSEDVIHALEADYHNYKLFTHHDVEETLATAKENGLLDEFSCDLDDTGELRIYYRISEFGRDMVERYI